VATVGSGLAPLDARIIEEADETIIIASGEEFLVVGATH